MGNHGQIAGVQPFQVNTITKLATRLGTVQAANRVQARKHGEILRTFSIASEANNTRSVAGNWGTTSSAKNIKKATPEQCKDLLNQVKIANETNNARLTGKREDQFGTNPGVHY